jgi:hypothetical protein
MGNEMKTLKELVAEARQEFLQQREIAIGLDAENGEKVWLRNLKETLDDDHIRRLNRYPRGSAGGTDTRAGAYQIAGRQLLRELK